MRFQTVGLVGAVGIEMLNHTQKTHVLRRSRCLLEG